MRERKRIDYRDNRSNVINYDRRQYLRLQKNQLQMFNVTRKKSDSCVQPQQVHQQSQQQLQLQQQKQQPSNCKLIKEKPKFTKCVSLTRIFGIAYSRHQHMSRQKNDATSPKARILFKNRSSNVANKLKIERFKNRSENQIEHMGTDCVDYCKSDKLPIEDFCDEKDLSARAFRTISKGLGLIWRRSYSVEISTPDPEYKVFYLGNVLTGWAKGMYDIIIYETITKISGKNKNKLEIQSKSRSTELGANQSTNDNVDTDMCIEKPSTNHHFDDDDDFHTLLMTNDYDMKSSLSGEILSYFDTELNKSSSILNEPEIASHPNGLDTDEHLSGEHKHHQDDSNHESNGQFEFESYNSTDSFCSLDNGRTSFNQNDVLNHMMASETKDSDSDTDKSNESSSLSQSSAKGIPQLNGNAMVPFTMDSDEGSITSGCETSSIITTAHMDDLIKSDRDIDAITLSLSRLPPKPPVSNLERVTELENGKHQCSANTSFRNTTEDDSEFSDESGFDENNTGKANHFRNRSITSNTESTSSADANNNIRHTFGPNATKSVGRLRTNRYIKF